MGVYIGGNKLVITTEQKTIPFDLSKDVFAISNLKHETDFIIKYNKLSAEHIIKNKIRQLLSKI